MATRRKPSKLDADQLWDYALRSLGMRSQATSELRQKLMRRASTPSDVASVLARLKEYGLADDKNFSETFASSRLRNQGFGRERVLRELKTKRVAPTIATAAVERIYSETTEPELVEQFLGRKFRGKDLAEFLREQKNFASAYRRLRLAGFSSAASLQALKKHATNSDWEIPEETQEES